MRNFLLGVGISAVFVVGCVAGASGLAVPKARAASTEGARWAYLCFDAQSTTELHSKVNEAGARGWELVSGVAHAAEGSGSTWCLRRPAAPSP